MLPEMDVTALRRVVPCHHALINMQSHRLGELTAAHTMLSQVFHCQAATQAPCHLDDGLGDRPLVEAPPSLLCQESEGFCEQRVPIELPGTGCASALWCIRIRFQQLKAVWPSPQLCLGGDPLRSATR